MALDYSLTDAIRARELNITRTLRAEQESFSHVRESLLNLADMRQEERRLARAERDSEREVSQSLRQQIEALTAENESLKARLDGQHLQSITAEDLMIPTAASSSLGIHSQDTHMRTRVHEPKRSWHGLLGSKIDFDPFHY